MIALEIASVVFGGGSLVTLIIFLINRHDTRNDEMVKINKQLKRLEKDGIRTQLLLLMRTYADEDEHELLQVAEHYFSKEQLNGNWYMTTLFKRFIKKHNIAQPDWFSEEQK